MIRVYLHSNKIQFSRVVCRRDQHRGWLLSLQLRVQFSSCSQALESVREMDSLGASLTSGGSSAAPLFRGARRARRRSRRAPNAHPTTGISASAPARLIERPPSIALSFTPVSHAHGRSVHRYNWYHPVERTCPSMSHPLIPRQRRHARRLAHHETSLPALLSHVRHPPSCPHPAAGARMCTHARPFHAVSSCSP